MIHTRLLRLVCLYTLVIGTSACTQSGAVSQRNYAVVGDTIPESLAQLVGSVDAGRQVFVARDTGHCVLCHQVASLDAPFQGDLGPDLTAVGQRLNAAQLRLRIVDASTLNPSTIMPSYYRVEGLHRVEPEFVGKTLLNAQQIEHLVAYLVSLDE